MAPSMDLTMASTMAQALTKNCTKPSNIIMWLVNLQEISIQFSYDLTIIVYC